MTPRKKADPIAEIADAFDADTVDTPIDTTNEFALHTGVNLPNHSTTLMGRGKFVRTGAERPVFRTKQAAYRFAAWLLTMAETLPDEDDAVSWEEMLQAVQSTKR